MRRTPFASLTARFEHDFDWNDANLRNQTRWERSDNFAVLSPARFFAAKMAETGIGVRALVVNRMQPRFGDGLTEAIAARAETLAGSPIGAHFQNLAEMQLVAWLDDDDNEGVQEIGSFELVEIRRPSS